MIVDPEADGATAVFALLHAAGGSLPRALLSLAHSAMLPDASPREAWGRPMGYARSCGAIVEDYDAATVSLAADHELTRSMLAALAECPDTMARARRALAKGRRAHALLARRAP